MTRGNQRELARAKNQKKQSQQKHKESGDPKKRIETHAEVMRKKQAAADAAKAEREAAAKNTSKVVQY